jgi:hypothetical protein
MLKGGISHKLFLRLVTYGMVTEKPLPTYAHRNESLSFTIVIIIIVIIIIKHLSFKLPYVDYVKVQYRYKFFLRIMVW